MQKFAFKMSLNPGCEAEYKRRHDELWPEMKTLLKEAGISDYSIHLDRETNTLFATMWRTDDNTVEELPKTEVVQRWWDYMADIMATDETNRPINTELVTVFHLP